MALVVLVPTNRHIEPECEQSLRRLEQQGIPVRRYRGYSQIDLARCQMATDALAAGFEELLWVDSDIIFQPDDVTKLQAHNLPFVAGVYAKKGVQQLAAEFPEPLTSLPFGAQGGLVPVTYVGFGFALTRRTLFDQIRIQDNLPTLNQQFPRPLVPYFAPFWTTGPQGRYLGEDYAFCERARRAGISLYADTTIRLWHLGIYPFGWEDAGQGVTRFPSYTYHLLDQPES
jgi:hypothetical protein